MSQECRCFLLTLQRYDNIPNKTNFLLIFVGTTCDREAHLRQTRPKPPFLVAWNPQASGLAPASLPPASKQARVWLDGIKGGGVKRAAKLRFFPKTPSLSAKNRQITWTDAEKCLFLHLNDHNNTSKYEKKNVLPAH